MSLRRPSKEQPENFEFNSSSRSSKKIVQNIQKENNKVLLWLYFILLKNKIIIGYL